MARKTVEEAIVIGIPALDVISMLTDAIREVGQKFRDSEIFLPELIMATDAMDAGMAPALAKLSKTEVPRVGSVVIGTVKGDVHDIGKNIVSTMLRAEGFEIHDLGKDVPSSRFAEEAEKLHPNIVALSALMASSTPVMGDVIEYFKAAGIRDKYNLIVGGAPVTREYAIEINADGYAPDAVGAAELATRIVQESPMPKQNTGN